MHIGFLHIVHVDRRWTGACLDDEENAVRVLLDGKQVVVVIDGGGDFGNRQELRQDEALFFHFDPALDGELFCFHESIDQGRDSAITFKRVACFQRNAVIAASSDALDGLTCGQRAEGHSRRKFMHVEESVFAFRFGERVLKELMRVVSVCKLEGR